MGDRCDDRTLVAVGMQLVGLLANREFDRAQALFCERMRLAMSPRDLEAAWDGILARNGRLQGLSGASCDHEGGYRSVRVSCGFSTCSLVEVMAVFGDTEEILGLWFYPREGPYCPPVYVDQGCFIERECMVGEHSLPGRVTVPRGEGPFPGVVLVHGSGPNDMDETLWETKVFRDLAWGLSSDGVVVLRYDKRSRARPGLFQGSFTIEDEVVGDAAAAVRALRSMGEVDRTRVYVLGHSLGGMMAPRIALLEPEVAGLILMAAHSGHLEDAFLEQIEYLVGVDGTIDPQEAALLEETRQTVRKIKELDISDGEMVLGAGRAYWEDLASYHQLEAVWELDVPFLVLQGGRDYQVTAKDLTAWKEALVGKDATFITHPDLNHLMVSGEGPSTPVEYTRHGHVAQEVVEDIIDWIGSR